MNRVLGLDSGGTKTIAAVADRSGTVVGLRSCQGLDPTTNARWEEQLRDLTAPFGAVEAATLGLPFHGEIPGISDRQSVFAAGLFGPRTQVLNDVAVAFEGALGGKEGVLILAGTGSMAWARGAKGIARTGGWGPAFGDEGSAYWIGREALSLVSRDLDGRRPSAAFAEAILGALGIAGADLIGWAHDLAQPRSGIASIALHVSAPSRNGDADAQALMFQAATHLSELGHAAARASGATLPLRWSYAGGVFDDLALRRSVAGMMGLEPVPPCLPPVGGAILHAARSARWVVDDAFLANLDRSLTTKTALKTER